MNWFSGEQHQPFHLEAGPTAVLLIHGFMGTPAELRPVAGVLADAGVTARGILLPGFGPDIARLGSVTRHDWIRAARDAWDELSAQYPRVAVLGYSMGGAVALHLVAQRPASQLMLVAPLRCLLSGDPRGLLMPLLPLVKRVVHQVRPFEDTDFSDPDMRKYFNEMMPSLDLDDPQALEALRSQAVLPTATIDEMRRLATPADDLARRVATPTLVIQGAHDQIVQPADTRRLVANFSGPLAYHQLPGDHLLLGDDRPSWPAVRDLVVSFAARPAVVGGIV